MKVDVANNWKNSTWRKWSVNKDVGTHCENNIAKNIEKIMLE
jgi:hypothetical protein